MKRTVVFGAVMVLLIMSLYGSSQAQIVGEPDEFNIDLVQGAETKRDITITNNGNTTLIGHIWVMNVECGWECPSAHLSIGQSEQIELEPGESLEAVIHITSSILNDPQEITLPIVFYTEDHENETTVADIHITVRTNYLVCPGIPAIIIILIIAIIIVIKKIRPAKIPPDMESKKTRGEYMNDESEGVQGRWLERKQ